MDRLTHDQIDRIEKKLDLLLEALLEVHEEEEREKKKKKKR